MPCEGFACFMKARVAPAVTEGCWDEPPPFFCEDPDLEAAVDFPVAAFGPVGGVGVDVEGARVAAGGAGDAGVELAVLSLRLRMIGVG